MSNLLEETNFHHVKLPISVMVVGYNEASLLTQCFSSINFCDEIFYADLGSRDNSIQIAEQFGAKIYQRSKVPSGEYIQSEIVNYTKHEWVIFIDPDERVDETLKTQIFNEFEHIISNDKIGAVIVPWQFYFKTHQLRGTVWGQKNQKELLVNKNRFNFLPITHYGRKLKDEFINYDISLNNSCTNVLHHYWMNSLKVFLQKHKRYLKNEGADNYNAGIRVGIKKVLETPFKEFYHSFINKKGYKDGFTGLFLSSFWAYYKTHIALDILQIQNKKKSK